KPDVVSLVPERPQEITTEGGLDVKSNRKAIQSAIKQLSKAGIFISLFIDPDLNQIKVGGELGVYQVEICTASYALLNEHPGDASVRRTGEIEKELERIERAARTATGVGLKVAAGHGLTYRNVGAVARIPEIEEFNIGHNI